MLDDDSDKKEEEKNDKLSDDEINKFAEDLLKGDISNSDFKEFERKLNERQKRHRQKHIFRLVLFFLVYLVTLFAVNTAAIGFLSSMIRVASWDKGLIYIACVTGASIFLWITFEIMALFPAITKGYMPLFLAFGRPVILFVLMLIANYKFDYLVFKSWFGIVLFLLISYAFQFAITYYRYKGRIKKLL